MMLANACFVVRCVAVYCFLDGLSGTEELPLDVVGRDTKVD